MGAAVKDSHVRTRKPASCGTPSHRMKPPHDCSSGVYGPTPSAPLRGSRARSNRLPEIFGEAQADEEAALREMMAANPILDGENAELKRRAGHFYSGLLLASPFAPAHSPVMLSGSRRHGEIGVRSQDNTLMGDT